MILHIVDKNRFFFFLCSGSLFGLLQRNTTKLDWRRRIHMAMDIVSRMLIIFLLTIDFE